MSKEWSTSLLFCHLMCARVIRKQLGESLILAWKHLPIHYLFDTKGKWHSVYATLTKGWSLSCRYRMPGLRCLLVSCSEDTTSHVLCFCPKLSKSNPGFLKMSVPSMAKAGWGNNAPGFSRLWRPDKVNVTGSTRNRGNSPDKNTGVGSHSLPQGIFPTQELNPCLLHCRQILYHLSHQGSKTRQ